MPVKPRELVRQLPPYEKPQEGRYNCIRLDFNENTRGFADLLDNGELPGELINTYPEYAELTNKIAELYKLDPDSVLLTNGSDEGISVIASTFIEPNIDIAVVSEPCFAMIPHCLKLAGAQLKSVKVNDDLSFNIEGINKVLAQNIKMSFFASPENPTGAQIEYEQVIEWCKTYPETLFVIDEAYGEYGQKTCLDLINKFDNLLVLKTFSKAWGMAGLRLGVVFGQNNLLENLKRVKLPYSVNAAAVWTASRLIDNWSKIKNEVSDSLLRLDQLSEQIEKRGYKLKRGASNSVLLELGFAAKAFTRFCASRSILVRDRSQIIEGVVRVSVGTEDENEKFLQTLDSFGKSYGIMFDLDDTLVDTSESFAQVVAELVDLYSGIPLTDGELNALRAEGGFNDDWVATKELINRRGYEADIEDILLTAMPKYMSIARKKEKLICDLDVLKDLSQRHPLFIVTGRCRVEYEPIWAERLNPYFENVYCVGDRPDCQVKPSGDYLKACMDEYGLTDAVYVGNSVDDMTAAKSLNISAIGISSTLSAEFLKSSGAKYVVESVDELRGLFKL